MAIKNWLIIGDQHRNFTDFKNIESKYQNPESAVIILGDVGFNVTLNKNDDYTKKGFVKRNNCYVYCVKGNHEARPSDVKDMKLVYDENVDGEVWMQDSFPTIRYFKEFGIYTISGYKCLIVGGAYSVDKWHRLMYDWPWFPNEQLTTEEMQECMKMAQGQYFDFVFTHTCPIDWAPTDLFINNVSQSKIDRTMEIWMSELKESIQFGVWCFGHYHQDRIERPYVELCFHQAQTLNEIWERWNNYKNTGELHWWLLKSPQFYWK